MSKSKVGDGWGAPDEPCPRCGCIEFYDLDRGGVYVDDLEWTDHSCVKCELTLHGQKGYWYDDDPDEEWEPKEAEDE